MCPRRMPWLADRSPTPRIIASRRGLARGDLVDALQRLDLLDQHLQADAADLQAELALQLGEQVVDEPHVARPLDLRDDDHVDVRARRR